MFLFAGHMIITTCKHTPYTNGQVQIHFSLDIFSFIGCLSYYPKDNPFVSVKFYRYGILDDLLRRFSCLSSFRSSRSAIFQVWSPLRMLSSFLQTFGAAEREEWSYPLSFLTSSCCPLLRKLVKMMVGEPEEMLPRTESRKGLLTMDQRNSSSDLFISISGLIGTSLR